MRVAILGIGGLGRTLASELRTDPRVTALLLADQKGERARILTAMRGRVPIEARQLNLEDAAALVRTIRGYDVVVNATLPKYNLAVMEAALQAGTDYLDVGATGPRTPGGQPGIFEQLDLDERFKAAGRTALLSMGIDPGMSSVLARDAAARMDTVDAIRIRNGATTSQAGVQSFPLYSREAFLADILVPPTVWEDGALREREPLGEEEEYVFPDPLGPQRAYLVSHEETKTLPRFLGKPVRRVDYKVALNPHLVRALLALERLGLLADERMIRIGDQMMPFRRALLAAFPEPSALMLPLQGYEALSVEVDGTRAGQRLVRRGDIVFANQEANRRRSTTAAHYLTAVGVAIGLVLMEAKAIGGPGVRTAEALEPAAVWKEWEARKLPLVWSERTPG
jgi:saccharopine dehydrogenase (NAD+, L-lysine-forming)